MNRVRNLASLVGCALGFMASAIALAQESETRDWKLETGSNPDSIPVPLALDLVFEEVRAGQIRGRTAGSDERLIYGNTLGLHSVNFPSNQPVSDDIATTAPDGCALSRYRFKVLGKVQPTGASGPYSVTYGLYSTCPNAVGSNNATRDLVRLPGTEGVINFPDDSPRTIEHIVPDNLTVPLPSNFYLGIRFNRGNCGTVVGAPALIGFSDDRWDFPGAPCNGYLGGFPQLPHASFWLEVYARGDCVDSFVAYKSQRPSGTTLALGADVQGFDDAGLIVEDCQMVGYEVTVRGVAEYSFDLRPDCASPPIPGTQRTYVVEAGTEPLLQVARFSFDPPIPLGGPLVYLSFQASEPGAGPVLAGIESMIGFSKEDYYDSQCAPLPRGQGAYGALNLAIACAGTLPLGACCDSYLTQCYGGPDAGKRCACNAICEGGADNGVCCSPASPCASPGICKPVCAAPGTCEAVCRRTTELNCPFPPPSVELLPQWEQGAACEPDPFGNTPCGRAACCHKRPVFGDPHELEQVCINMTRNECFQQEPLDEPRQWQLGQFCRIGAQTCSHTDCIGRIGQCYVAHDTPGCNDPFCCSGVCADDSFCCNTAWDSECVTLALYYCAQHFNDQCAAGYPNPHAEGALTLPMPGSATADNRLETTHPGEPGFCCNTGTGMCIGGSNDGATCVVGTDCPSGECSEPVPAPGAQGFGTIWFRWVQPPGITTAGVHTCNSNPPASDSILQVFQPLDNSSALAQCLSLVQIGCNDDSPTNCGSSQRNSRLCLRDLTPGQTYYVELAAKTESRLGAYRLTLTTSCSGETEPCSFCPDGDFSFVDPPSGVVDARRPHPPGSPDSPEGIQIIKITGRKGATPDCWQICSSDQVSVDADIVEHPPGSYAIKLAEPVRPGTALVVAYTDENQNVRRGVFFAHPGNVNASEFANERDILALIDFINGVSSLPWGKYSGDLDHSGAVGPADILTLIDLLNGANDYAAWDGTSFPGAEPCP